MLIDPILLVRRRRRVKVRKAPVAPVAAGPVLVGATYVVDASVTLTFDRAVVVTADSMSSVVVVDGNTSELLQGDDFEVLSPTSVRVNLYVQTSETGVGVVLSTEGETGIATADGEVPWAGVSGVDLPFESAVVRTAA